VGQGSRRTFFGRALSGRWRAVDSKLKAAQETLLTAEGFEEATSYLVNLRAPLSLATRTCGRLVSLWQLNYHNDPRTRRFRRLLALFIMADFIEYRELKRRRVGGFAKPRMARDLAELAALTGPVDGFTGPVISATPVLTELGLRYGLYAGPAIIPYLGTLALARWAARRRFEWGTVLYAPFAVLAGVGLRRAQLHRIERHTRARRAVMDAARRSALCIGRRKVASTEISIDGVTLKGGTAVDSVVNSFNASKGAGLLDPDLLAVLTPAHPLQRLSEANREVLLKGEELSGSDAVMVPDCLERWKFWHKSTHIIAREQVYAISWDEDLNSAALTLGQSDDLTRKLTELPLAGEVHVALQRWSGYGGPLSLHIKSADIESVVDLAGSDRTQDFSFGNALEAATLVASFYSAVQMTAAGDAVPVSRGLPGAMAHLACAIGSRGYRDRPGERAATVAALGLCASTIQLVGAGGEARRRPFHPNGTPRLPSFHALSPLAVVQGVLWRDLGSKHKALLSTGNLGLFLVGTLGMRRPRPLTSLFTRTAISTTALFASGILYRSYIDRDIERERLRYQDYFRTAVLDCEGEGELAEWRLVRAASEALQEMMRRDVSGSDAKAIEAESRALRVLEHHITSLLAERAGTRIQKLS
jgi:hypothetical protein